MDIPFIDVVQFLNEFTRVSRGFKKNCCARNHMRRYKDQIALTYKYKDDCIASFYSLMKLILPGCDRDRVPYGIKEYKFSRIIMNMLRLPEKSADALALTNFRSKKVIDFAEAAFFVLRKYYNRPNDKITVGEIHKYLDAIADENANKDARKCPC